MGEHAGGEGPVLSRSRLVRLRQEEADLRARVQPLLDEHGLLPEHWRILAVVDDHPGITMTSLATSAVVAAASLTRHVDRLVELALVVRRIDPADRRRAVLALSPRGADLAARLLAEEEGSDLGTSPAGLADVTGRA